MSASQSGKEVILHGYDAVFVPELDPKYRCPVCLAALRDPVQTRCGHRFCRICLRRSRGKSLLGKCPVDKIMFDPASHVFEDNAVRREVLSLIIKCDNHTDGCRWKGELRDRETHVGKCPEAKVVCRNSCGHVCSTRSMPAHHQKCPRRTETCQKCGLTLIASELAKHHLLVCEKFPVTCTVCGEIEIIRENMARHVNAIDGDCPMVIVKCQFENIGCYFQDKRKNMPTHNQSSNLHHMELLVIKVQQQDELMANQQHHLATMFQQYRQLTSVIEEQQCTIEDQGCMLKVQGACIRELKDCNGHLIWNVHLPEDRSVKIVSPAFFTHLDGAKVKLVMDFATSESSSGSPLTSLFVDATAGERGERFRGTCHVTIFSQSRQLDDYHKAFVFGTTSESGIRQGLLGFMATERLYTGPYTRNNHLVVLIAIRSKVQ